MSDITINDNLINASICMICDSEETSNNLHQYPCCNHSSHFGIQCLTRIVSDKIKESALSNLCCPYPGCKQKFNKDFIKGLVTVEEYDKYISDLNDLDDLDDIDKESKKNSISKYIMPLMKKGQRNLPQLHAQLPL